MELKKEKLIKVRNELHSELMKLATEKQTTIGGVVGWLLWYWKKANEPLLPHFGEIEEVVNKVIEKKVKEGWISFRHPLPFMEKPKDQEAVKPVKQDVIEPVK